MLRIKIIAVGKIKEKFFAQAVDEYKKRLSSYCRLEIIELADEKTPDSASQKEEEQIKDKEGERILGKISDQDYVITLEIKGRPLDSEQLAAHIDSLATSGKSSIAFVIGGSLGLSTKVSARSNYKLSFSAMTFPHQLMRVILLEQIYRSFRIINNQPYHK